MDIGAWLRSLGLAQFEQVFRDNAIDSDVLPELADEHLKELGLPLGSRLKLLNAIAALRGKAVEHPPAKAPPPALAMPGERRQVTVLFADLAGYTALSNELDAEEVYALLERFFDRVDRIVGEHGGHVEKHIGDCTMGVFGAPVAHGNDAERAVRAALAIRDVMPELSEWLGRPLGIHIGIAGGQVVASGMGTAAHREYTVTGDTVNLASRLTDAAAPGEIFISERVRAAVAERFDCVAAGMLSIKGFMEPVRAWRLRGLRPTPAGERAPLVGRQSELRQFLAALAACRETGRGQTIYLRGEAGVGKTRLVEEFQHKARAAGFACHSGVVLDFGAGASGDAIRALVRSVVGLDITSEAEAVRAAAERAPMDGLVTPEDAIFFNDLLDLAQPTAWRALYDAMDNHTRNEGKLRTVGRLIERASRSVPCLLVIEDVHWADRSTLTQLARLTATVSDCPALLVITSRIEGDPLGPEWRGEIAGAPLMTIDLGPLRREEALTFAGTFIEAMDRFAEQCVERAAGNPLFLEQLLRHAEESAEEGVPGSVQNLVQARVDRLDPEDKAALQAASVLGQRFGQDALVHLLERPNYAPNRLVAHFLVRPQGEAFLFAHALVRDAVYDMLLRTRRRELHRRAAEFFADRDPVLRAEHLDRAEDADAPKAYLAAARAQAAEYRFELAQHLVERGLALAVERADLFALASLQGEVLHDLGDMPAAKRAYETALAAAESGTHRCQAWIGLAAVKRVTDDLDGAFADLDQAEVEAGEEGLTAEQARIHYLRGNLFFPRGDIAGCLREHGKSLKQAQVAGSAELEAAALGGLADANYAIGKMQSARELFTRCIELARAAGLGRVALANAPMLGIVELLCGRPEAARRTLDEALQASLQAGSVRSEMICHHLGFLMRMERDGAAAARAEIDRAEEIAASLGAKRFQCEHRAFLAWWYRSNGNRAEALRVAREGWDMCEDAARPYMGPVVLGQIAASTEDEAEREWAIQESREILAAGALSHCHFFFYWALIEADIVNGRPDCVAEWADALEKSMAEPCPWIAYIAAWGRAMAGHQGAGPQPEDEALRHLSEQGRRLGFLRLASMIPRN